MINHQAGVGEQTMDEEYEGYEGYEEWDVHGTR